MVCRESIPSSVVGFRFGAKPWPLLLLIGLLIGCSGTQFFYNRLDTLIGWYVDDFVELDTEQRSLFEDQLEAFFEWHRREELPQYIALIDRAISLLDAPLAVRELEPLVDDARDATDRLRAHALTALLRLGESLSDQQFSDFMAELERRQQASREAMLARDDGAYRQDIADRIEDNLEDYLGRLSREQRQLVAEGAGRYVRLDALWLSDRERWLAALGGILKDRRSDWQAEVQTLMARRAPQRDADFQRAIDTNTTVTLRIVTEVLSQRSARQDRKLRRKLSDLREDFAALTAAEQ